MDALKFLAKLLGLKEDEIETATVDSLNSAWNKKQKDLTDNAHRSGQGQAFKAIRTSLLSIGIKTNEGDDSDAISKAVESHKVDTSEVTEEMVRSHKLYSQLLGDFEKTKQALEQEKTDSARKENIRKISDKVKSTLLENFKIPKNEDAANKRLDLLVNELSKITEKKGIFYIDGKALEDENHQPLVYDDIVKKYALTFYDEKSSDDNDDNDSPPNEKKQKSPQTSLTPKTNEELNAIIMILRTNKKI
jgi:hypothetical protein